MYAELMFEMNTSDIETGEPSLHEKQLFEIAVVEKFPFLERWPIEIIWNGNAQKYTAELSGHVRIALQEGGALMMEFLGEQERDQIGGSLDGLSCNAVTGDLWFPQPPNVIYRPGVYRMLEATGVETRCILDWDEEKGLWCMSDIWVRSPALLIAFMKQIRGGHLKPIDDFSGVKERPRRWDTPPI